MSRYLDYSEPNATNNGGCPKTLLDKPPHLKAATGLICGPEELFRSYLTKTYRGGSTVLCGARIVSGQCWPNTLSTFVMTLGPGLLYWFMVLPHYLTLYDLTVQDSVIGLSQAILGVTIVVSFLMASFMNPGIVPRNDKIADEIDRDLNGNPSARFLRINNITVKQKFCSTCLIFRPPRSKHCSFCDNCVLRFDHHCTWLGNCVGLHNYRFYVCLIYSATIFLLETIAVVAQVLADVANRDYATDDVIKARCAMALLTILLMYCLVVLGAVFLLSIYHTVISLQNLTTNEHVKNYYRDNPFDFGGLLNCVQIYCFPERVLATGDDTIEADYVPFGSYSDGLSFDEN